MAQSLFSIGDRIRIKGSRDNIGFYVKSIDDGYYICDADITHPISMQHLLERL